MSLRRARSHYIGISNIDFRTKKDEENLRIFEPWKAPKDFGTMGYREYKHSPKTQRLLFSPTERINTHKDIVNDYPDPRYYTTAKFYKDNNIDLKIRSIIDRDRVSNLEETFKGKDVYIGDGMDYLATLRKRKGKKDKKYKLNRDQNLLEDHKLEINKIESLAKEKMKINKDVVQETQLTKMNINKTDNNLLNMSKIKEIRQLIRRRYGNRKNVNKIFQQWARTFPNKITVYDAYKMINSLNIPINYNETRAFIASGSNFGNEFLNLDEFSNLIFNKNEDLYEDPWKVKPKQEDILKEKEQENLKNKIIENNKEIDDNVKLKILKDFLSQKSIYFIKNLKEISKEKYYFTKIEYNDKINFNNINLNKCNYDKFTKTILSLKPSESFSKEKYIKTLFDEYKDKDNLVDVKFFLNDLYDKNSKSNNDYMSKLKDNLSDVFKEQVEAKKKDLKHYVSENKDKKDIIYRKKYDLDNHLLIKKENELREKRENEKQITEVNCTVPSTPWIHHVYDKRNEHYNILNRAEYSFSAKPSIKQKCNTRFGANPKWRNTAEILVGNELDPTYISEKERFNLDRNVGKDDKIKIARVKMGRENRIRTDIQKFEESNLAKHFLKEEKNKYSQMEKCKRQFEYEELFKNRNFLIE